MKNKLRIIILLLLVVATALFIGMPNGQKVSELTCQNYTPNFSKPGEACCSFNLNEYQSASDICKQEVEPIELELNPKNQISLSINNALDSQQQLEIELVNKKAHKQYLIYARNLIAAGGIPAEKIEALPGMIFNSAYQNPSPQWYLLAMVKAQKTKKGAIQFVLSHAGKTYKAKKRKKKLNLKIQTLVAEPGTQEFLIYALKKKGAVPDKAYFFAGTPPVFEDYDQDGDGYCRIGTEPAACTLTPGDCDDNNAEVYRELVLYPDADADNYTALGANICIGKTLPANYFIQEQERDCDDANPQILGKKSYYIDKDGDGYGEDASLLLSCESQVGYVDKGGDPNDNDPSIFPGTDNDDDTDGVINRLDCAPQDKLKWKNHSAYLDTDNDNYTTGDPVPVCSNNELPAGYKASKAAGQIEDDCRPNDVRKYRNGTFKVDADGDSYGVGNNVIYCYGASVPTGKTTNISDTDCDDSKREFWKNLSVYPDLDNDNYTTDIAVIKCSGDTLPPGYRASKSAIIDCDDSNIAIWKNYSVYLDADNDNYTTGNPVSVCGNNEFPAGYKASKPADQIEDDCRPNDVRKYRNGTFKVDADGDSYGVGNNVIDCYGASVPTGKTTNISDTDCDDSKREFWKNLSVYPDLDNDNYTTDIAVIKCSGDTLPPGYRVGRSVVIDCNDGVRELWQDRTYTHRDADGDAYYVPMSGIKCSGATLPSGYLNSYSGIIDCDDSKINIWKSYSAYLDSDNDNYTTGNPVPVCGNNQFPAGYKASKPADQIEDDCRPNDVGKYRNGTFKVDADGDSYGVGDNVIDCYGASVPTGKTTNISDTDCDDSKMEIWQNISAFADADNDNYTTGLIQPVCSGNSLPPGYKVSKAAGQTADDCSPADKFKWQNYNYSYTDNDSDYLYVARNGTVCSDTKIPDKYRQTYVGPVDTNDSLAWEPTNANALCLFNSNSARSKEICDYYNLKRPGSYQFGVALTSSMFYPDGVIGNCAGSEFECMAYNQFIINVSSPLKLWLASNPDKFITHIATAKDIPFRLHVQAQDFVSASFYLEYLEAQVGIKYYLHQDYKYKILKNKYCEPETPCKHFHPALFLDNGSPTFRHVVSWLNGYTVEDIKRMIDRAQLPSKSLQAHQWIIDGDLDRFSIHELHLEQFKRLSNFFATYSNASLLIDQTNTRPLVADKQVVGYFGPGNYHAGYDTKNWALNPSNFNFNVAPRAIFTSNESFNSHSFNGTPFPLATRESPWGQGQLSDGFHSNAFGGTNYSRAFSGALGNVDEPNSGIVDFRALATHYVRGLTFAEAAFAANNLNFVNIAVGDPLMTFSETNKLNTLPAGQLCEADAECTSNRCQLDFYGRKRCAKDNVSCIRGENSELISHPYHLYENTISQLPRDNNKYGQRKSYYNIGESTPIGTRHCLNEDKARICTTSGWADETSPANHLKCLKNNEKIGYWKSRIGETCNLNSDCLENFICQAAPGSSNKFCYPQSACKSGTSGDYISNYELFCKNNKEINICDNGNILAQRTCTGSCLDGALCSEDGKRIPIVSYANPNIALAVNFSTSNNQLAEAIDIQGYEFEDTYMLSVPSKADQIESVYFPYNRPPMHSPINQYEVGAVLYFNHEIFTPNVTLELKSGTYPQQLPKFTFGINGKMLGLHCPANTKASKIIELLQSDGLNCYAISPMLYRSKLDNGSLKKIVYRIDGKTYRDEIQNDFDINSIEAYNIKCDLPQETIWQARCG